MVTADREFAAASERNLTRQSDLQVKTVTTVGAAIDVLAATDDIDCIVSDHDLPDTDGVAFLEVVRAHLPTLPFILFTSEGNETVASRAISADVTEYLIKEHHSDQWERLTRFIIDAVAFSRKRDDFLTTETRATTLLDAVQDMIVVVREGRLEYVNQTGVDLLEAADRTAVTGRSVGEMISTDADIAISEHLRPIQTAETSLEQFEAQLTRGDGSTVPVEVTATRIPWMDAPSVILVLHDISARKAGEHTLRWFRQAVEAAGHAIYITDSKGVITYVNPAFEQITGYASAEAIGRNPRILKSGEMSEDYYDRLWATVLEGEVWVEEVINQRHNGERYYAHQTIAPVIDDAGDVEAFVAVQTDISEQKDREAQLRQYGRAINGAAELITAFDDEYTYIFANPAYRQFHGIETPDITDTRLPTAIGEAAFETAEPYIKQALSGDIVRYRMRREQPDKPARTFDIRYTPLEDEMGSIQGVVATMRDLTEQIERETQLASLDRLLRHNLHNGLNVILGRAELIATQPSGDIGSHVKTIETAAERLLEQADKEREIVELLTGQSNPTAVNMNGMVEAVVAEIKIDHPEVDISLDIPETVEVRTVPQVERAIEEVIENAVIHNDHESPAITISIEEHDERIELSVADDGPGIPPAEQKVIGEEATIGPLLHSEGMGLWLVKRVMTHIGGTLRFDGTASHGSVVTLVIPRSFLEMHDPNESLGSIGFDRQNW
ncbi:Signal transduction regulator [Halapricum desulfuricans]|uniref:histidine kinase n=2 Tax=Halapricum desulfuricans TaxID=2841257 RepID=A0A897NDB0_9EURY|nr:Signal transduction regulator [Halapricum desulfuricans]